MGNNRRKYNETTSLRYRAENDCRPINSSLSVQQTLTKFALKAAPPRTTQAFTPTHFSYRTALHPFLLQVWQNVQYAKSNGGEQGDCGVEGERSLNSLSRSRQPAYLDRRALTVSVQQRRNTRCSRTMRSREKSISEWPSHIFLWSSTMSSKRGEKRSVYRSKVGVALFVGHLLAANGCGVRELSDRGYARKSVFFRLFRFSSLIELIRLTMAVFGLKQMWLQRPC